jgi:hypothetical protein
MAADPSSLSTPVQAIRRLVDDGAVTSINLNYLNPPNFGAWGNDQIRVFGARGMAESVDAALPISGDLPAPPYIAHYARFLLDGTPMPASLDEEMALHEAAATGARIAVRYPDRDRR